MISGISKGPVDPSVHKVAMKRDKIVKYMNTCRLEILCHCFNG